MHFAVDLIVCCVFPEFHFFESVVLKTRGRDDVMNKGMIYVKLRQKVELDQTAVGVAECEAEAGAEFACDSCTASIEDTMESKSNWKAKGSAEACAVDDTAAD